MEASTPLTHRSPSSSLGPPPDGAPLRKTTTTGRLADGETITLPDVSSAMGNPDGLNLTWASSVLPDPPPHRFRVSAVNGRRSSDYNVSLSRVALDESLTSAAHLVLDWLLLTC